MVLEFLSWRRDRPSTADEEYGLVDRQQNRVFYPDELGDLAGERSSRRGGGDEGDDRPIEPRRFVLIRSTHVHDVDERVVLEGHVIVVWDDSADHWVKAEKSVEQVVYRERDAGTWHRRGREVDAVFPPDETTENDEYQFQILGHALINRESVESFFDADAYFALSRGAGTR